jgi:hypothetical protein
VYVQFQMGCLYHAYRDKKVVRSIFGAFFVRQAQLISPGSN